MANGKLQMENGKSEMEKEEAEEGGLLRCRRVTGKVATLPKAARSVVNGMLDDGQTYEAIVERLTGLGFPGFNAKNISRWKLNGYEQWLRRQERVEEIKLRSETALEMAQGWKEEGEMRRMGPMGAMKEARNGQLPCGEGGVGGLWAAGEGLLALEVVEALLETSQAELSLEDKGKLLYRIGRVLAANKRERTRSEKQNLDAQKYGDERVDLQAPPRQKRDLHEPLTQEETESIVHKVDQLFGIKLKVPGPETKCDGTDASDRSNRTNGSGMENAKLQMAEGAEEHGLTREDVGEPGIVPVSGPMADRELQVGNGEWKAEGAESRVDTSGALPNPNPVGEWPQPPGTIPIINVLGCIVGWAAHPEIAHAPDLTLRDPAANKADPIACNGKTILWYDRNAQVRNCPTKYPIPGRAHFIPVINAEGQVIDWCEWDDEWLSDLPAQNPRPLLTDGFRGQIIAWIDERERDVICIDNQRRNGSVPQRRNSSASSSLKF